MRTCSRHRPQMKSRWLSWHSRQASRIAVLSCRGAGQRGRSGRYSPRVQRPESPPRRPKCGKHMMGLFYFRRGAFYSKRGVRGSGEGRRSGFGIDRRGGVVISRPESFPCPTGRILRVFAGVHSRIGQGRIRRDRSGRARLLTPLAGAPRPARHQGLRSLAESTLTVTGCNRNLATYLPDAAFS